MIPFMKKHSSTTSAMRRGSWLTRLMLLALMLVGIGSSASAVPSLTGFNHESGELFFPITSDTIKVYYDEPVVKTYWALEQDGQTVLEGTCTGKDQNQPYATIAMKTALYNAIQNKTVALGKATLKITKVEYDGDLVAENLGSIEWNITDAPLCNAMNPYPVPEDKTITEVKSNTTCSYQAPTGSHFGAGYQIKQVKARIIQNGNVLDDEVLFEGKISVSSGKYTYSASAKITELPVWDKIDAGVFEIQFYEVTYISQVDDQEKTLNVQPALPAKWLTSAYQVYKGVAITYGRKTAPATSQIVEESLPERTGEILSYYPADGTEGVLTYKANVAIDPTNLKAEFSYGNMDIPFTKSLPISVSDDGLTMTIDLRGMLNNRTAITGGYEFKDDNGNPTSGPTQISIEVTGLNAVGGGGLCTIWQSPDGSVKVAQYGKMWRTYAYNDITFSTPKLATAQFYDNANPTVKTDAIIASSNTVDLTVDGDDVITDADVVFTAGEVVEKVAYANVTRAEGVWTMSLPAAIKAAGSANLLIGLENVTYNKVDGAEHVIEPLDVAKNGGAIKQVMTVKEIRELENNIDFMLNSEALKVTVCDADQGLAMFEDETGGLMLDPSVAVPFHEGKLVKGSIIGTYLGSGMVRIDNDKSNFTEEDADITSGMVVEDVSQLLSQDNLYRLMTVNASEDISMAYSEDAQGILIADAVVAYDVLNRLPANYEYPAKIGQVTGVTYSISGVTYLILRSADDIVAGKEDVVVDGIAAAAANASEEPFKVNVKDAKVTFSGSGMAFVEDETGGTMIVMADESEFGTRGQSFTGQMQVMYMGGTMLVVLDKSGLTAGTADVTLGKEIKGTEVVENAGRLVTFTAENNTFDNQETMIMVDGEGIVTDMFGVLGDDYEWPAKIQSLTGVVYYDPNMGMAIVAVRDANDIVAVPTPTILECSTIAEIKALPEGTEAVLNLNGAKITHQMEGYNFLEDETGAIMIPEIALSQRGKALTGKIKGIAMGAMAFYVEDASNVTIDAEDDVDVKYGITLTAEQISDPAHHYRLVTFRQSDGHNITGDKNTSMFTIGDVTFAVDAFGVLGEDYIFPDNVISITGILMPNDAMGLDDAETAGAPAAFIAIRDANDIETDSTGITNIIVDGNSVSDVYNINGVKVRNAGESLNGLSTGVYIINGQKVFIKY